MFEQEKFSKILNKIVDQYGSTVAMSNAAHVGRSYLSKYINKKIPSPPTPKILEKIAEASMGLTNYDELMQVCGYLNANVSSREILAQNLCKEYETQIYALLIPNLDLEHIYDILIKQNEKDATVLNQLSNYIEANYGLNDKTRQLFSILEELDKKIKDLVIVQNNVGSIPLYSISKVDMFKVGYFPLTEETKDYIAVKATNDKMLPLLDVDDIAVVHLQDNIVDGQTVLLLIDNKYYDIAKIYTEANTCKLYFMNAKFEELELNRIKIIGEVVLTQNKSAFKKRRD